MYVTFLLPIATAGTVILNRETLRIVMPWHRRVHSVWVGNLPGKGEGKLTKRRKPWVVLSSNVEMDGNSPNWGVNSAKNKLVIYRV